jgi:hypothetical protein
LLLDQNLPYFPIEISRTGAKGFSNMIFSYGSIPLLITMYMDGYNIGKILILISLFIITFNNDSTYLMRHQLGVLFLAMSFLYNIIGSENRKPNIMIFMTCIILYLIRLVAKSSFVLILVFNKEIFSFYTWYEFLTTKQFGLVYEACKDIMYNGEQSNYLIGNLYTEYIIHIFRLGGILQWIMFYLLSVTIK